MEYILIAFAFFVLGIISFPFLAFLRARSDREWDDSNITNMIRLLSHVIAHPSDFAKMQYPDGKKPFWYLDKDEFADIVNSRPNKKQHENRKN
jgi:hypothetical protein